MNILDYVENFLNHLKGNNWQELCVFTIAPQYDHDEEVAKRRKSAKEAAEEMGIDLSSKDTDNLIDHGSIDKSKKEKQAFSAIVVLEEFFYADFKCYPEITPTSDMPDVVGLEYAFPLSDEMTRERVLEIIDEKREIFHVKLQEYDYIPEDDYVRKDDLNHVVKALSATLAQLKEQGFKSNKFISDTKDVEYAIPPDKKMVSDRFIKALLTTSLKDECFDEYEGVGGSISFHSKAPSPRMIDQVKATFLKPLLSWHTVAGKDQEFVSGALPQNKVSMLSVLCKQIVYSATDLGVNIEPKGNQLKITSKEGHPGAAKIFIEEYLGGKANERGVGGL